MVWVNRVLLCTPLLPTGCLHPPWVISAGAVAIGWGRSAKCRRGRSTSWSSLSCSYPAAWPKEYKCILLLYFTVFSISSLGLHCCYQLLLSFTSSYEVFFDSILVNTLLLVGSVGVSYSYSWLCHPIPFLLPTQLFAESVHDLIQFTNVD